MFEANNFYNLLFCWTPRNKQTNKQTNPKRHIASVWGFRDPCCKTLKTIFICSISVIGVERTFYCFVCEKQKGTLSFSRFKDTDHRAVSASPGCSHLFGAYTKKELAFRHLHQMIIRCAKSAG